MIWIAVLILIIAEAILSYMDWYYGLMQTEYRPEEEGYKYYGKKCNKCQIWILILMVILFVLCLVPAIMEAL